MGKTSRFAYALVLAIALSVVATKTTCAQSNPQDCKDAYTQAVKDAENEYASCRDSAWHFFFGGMSCQQIKDRAIFDARLEFYHCNGHG